jgi:SAM-dependent methyltransferase
MSEDVRADQQRYWEASSQPWGKGAEAFGRLARPVTEGLLAAARLNPGQRVLELGAGPGEVGIQAAERVAPDGEVLVTDAVEGMVALARERTAGTAGVEVRREDAEAIDQPAASFDAVLSRWGLMFTVDPEAPFRECRRVLRPGGRLALAVWAPPAENPWFSVPGRELLEQGLTEPPPPGDNPGPFRFAAPGRLRGLLAGAGFDEVEVAPLPFSARFRSFDEIWELKLSLSSGLRDALALTHEEGARALRAGIERGYAPYQTGDGGYEVPLVALLGSATA